MAAAVTEEFSTCRIVDKHFMASIIKIYMHVVVYLQV